MRHLGLALALTLFGCSGKQSPPPATTLSLDLSASTTSVPNDGREVILTAQGHGAAHGLVDFFAARGLAHGPGTLDGRVEMAQDGSASGLFGCNQAWDGGCAPGPVVITASWLGQSAQVTVTLYEADAGAGDGG
jgi:hypothetical protein